MNSADGSKESVCFCFPFGGGGVVLTFYFEDVCNRLRNKFVAFNVFPHRM